MGFRYAKDKVSVTSKNEAKAKINEISRQQKMPIFDMYPAQFGSLASVNKIDIPLRNQHTNTVKVLKSQGGGP